MKAARVHQYWNRPTSRRSPTPGSPPTTRPARHAGRLRPGDTAVIIGAGGLGHIGVQALRALTAARGSYNDLVELMALAAGGRVRLHTVKYPLDHFDQALADLDQGKIRGRAVLVP
ncbi:hypothetical protein GCM10010191_95810 [Actinomadura vinacea]|uniref:alcohol dehydrogenase n=1 Tax=Actinomadura vinacea TaxID=115336 RepID=A0ABN3KL78_9ACTN